ncbi:MAG: DUF4973 domain-containing protein [Prevotella sp.]|jgi:hypothetical protein
MTIKNIKFLLITACVGCGVSMLTSCNDEWESEQYEQYISFRAPLDTEGNSVGVTTIHVPYTRMNADGTPRYGEGISSFDLPVIVSGSTHNSADRHVHIAYDTDTLNTLNYARFNTRKELYYQDMSSYTTFDDVLMIPKGQDKGLLTLRFDFHNFDLAEKWVLPLTIEDGPDYDYIRNPRKNYAKAMLRVLPYTDFSGVYQANNQKFYVNAINGEELSEAERGEPSALSEVQFYVVDANTVFFYAGNFDETRLDRKQYKIFARFHGDTSGTVELWCDNPDVKFVENKQASFRMTSEPDAVQPYLLRRDVIINNMDYNFTDHTSTLGSAIEYNVSGTLTMERVLNTQMPEEDQVVW